MTDDLDPTLASRLAAVAGPADDGDWLDVRRRARALRPMPRLRTRRLTLAAAIAVAAVAAAPPVGLAERIVSLGTNVADIVGGEPEDNFREHDGRKLPIYFSIGQRVGSDRLELSGIVWSKRIASLELRFAGGGTEPIAVGRDGAFRHVISTGRRPDQVIARDAEGRAVERFPVVSPGETEHAEPRR